MLDINGSEFLVILVIAVILVGPERLPDYVRGLRSLVTKVRGFVKDGQGIIKSELGADVDWSTLDPRQYDPRRIVRDALFDPLFADDAGKAGAGVAGAGTAAAGAAGVGVAAATAGTQALAVPAPASAPASADADRSARKAARARATRLPQAGASGANAEAATATQVAAPAGAPFDDEAT